MSYRQNVSPNLDPTIHQPNGQGGSYVLNDWLGWCLAYVQTAFSAGWGGTTAWDCWENHTINRHEDRNIPGGVYVPIFFSGAAGMGHTAIYKDGQVWSAPITHKPSADIWGSIEQVEQHYGVGYVGWSEGLGGTVVIDCVPDAPPPPRYTVTETYPNGKLIELNKQPTYLWGMNYDFEYMKDHPVETHGQGEVWTVANKVHHEDGYDYYRRDGQIDGFNVADCDDYTPPPPAKPQGAVAFPSPSETYSLIVDLPGYTTSNQAANHTGSTTIVSTGDYQVFTKRVDTTGKVIAVNVTRSAGVPGAWINPDDNHEPIPEPVAPTSSFIGPREGSPPEAPAVAVQPYTPPTDPFAWKSTYKPFPDGSHKYLAVRDMYITDKAGNDKNGINLNENDWIPMFGSFERDSITYLVPFLHDDKEHKYWYGIPTIDVARGLPNLHSEHYEKSLAQVSQENRQYRRSIGHETTADKIYYAQQYFDKLVAGGARFIDGIVKLRAGKK